MNSQNNENGNIKKGILYVILGHVVYCICVGGLSHAAFKLNLWQPKGSELFLPVILLAFIWFIQFIYVIPMAIYFRKYKQTLKGILIASGITFLLGGGICGAMLL